MTLSSDTKLFGDFDKVQISKPLSLTLEKGKMGTVQQTFVGRNGRNCAHTFQSTRQVAPNGKINSIFVTMKATEGVVIHYTTDGSEPTKESPHPPKLPFSRRIPVQS